MITDVLVGGDQTGQDREPKTRAATMTTTLRMFEGLMQKEREGERLIVQNLVHTASLRLHAPKSEINNPKSQIEKRV